MTHVLRLTVPHQLGEHATSLAARLAARGGVLSARHFCLDHGLDFTRLAEGDADQVARLASLAGAGEEALLATSFRLDGHHYALDGHRFPRRYLRRRLMTVCPACLEADANASDLAPEAAMYGRAVWQVGAIRTCHVHDLALTDIPRGQSEITYDHVAWLRPHLPRLGQIARELPSRSPTGLEGYVLGRLAGRTGAFPFLDGLETFAATRLCEVVGVVANHGRKQSLLRLEQEQWRAAGEAGFGIVSQGAGGLCRFMTDLIRTCPQGKSANEGPQMALGAFYVWLDANREVAAYESVRAVVREHIIASIPMGPGEVCFGTPVKRRVLHSIRSASVETGAHCVRLRKLLHHHGLIGDGHEAHADRRVTFDAEKAAPLLADLTGAMALRHVVGYVNVPRIQAQRLVEAGLLKPVTFAKEAAGLGWHAFAKSHLDAFMARLALDAEPVDGPVEDAFDIGTAARWACCSSVEVVRLILDRQLPWVGRRNDLTGYASILVRPADLRPLTRRRQEGLTVLEVTREIGTDDRTVRALIRTGGLRSFQGANPVTRNPQVFVSPDAVAEFRERYVSLGQFARANGQHPRRARERLRDRGVCPAFDPSTVRAHFYLRSDLVDAMR